jgi:hypothetical protein
MRTRLAGLFLFSGFASFAVAQPPADTFDFRARDDAHVAALSGDKGASATSGRVAGFEWGPLGAGT